MKMQKKKGSNWMSNFIISTPVSSLGENWMIDNADKTGRNKLFWMKSYMLAV